MDSSEPWYLTVVRAQGVLFLRPEKSWRPIVSISLVETGHTHETVLGCDGQNPNMKNPLVLRDVDCDTNLDIKIWHKSPTKKQRRKRHLVGSAYVLLGDLLRRQERPGSDLVLNLKSLPPKKKGPVASGARQANSATLTIRMRSPLPQTPSSESTLIPSEVCSVSSEDDLSAGTLSVDNLDSPITCTNEPEDLLPDTPHSSLRRRRRKKLKPYCLDSCEEDAELSCDSSCDSSCPETPPLEGDDFSYSYDADADTTFDTGMWQESEDVTEPCMPSVLPQHAGDEGKLEGERELSVMELLVDRIAPYREMSHSECDFNKVLGRLLTEWYAIGASLLATAALNAAVFGYSAPTLFDIDGLALRSVTIGSVASGIGLVADVWFLMFYSGADVEKFKRIALDVYNTYFFFCLTCRLPTLCLFVAVCCLLLFLLVVAWNAWSTAVLVMCCAAGVLLTLQYLVYGCHRMINLFIWTILRTGRAVSGLFTRSSSNVAAPTSNTAEPHTNA